MAFRQHMHRRGDNNMNKPNSPCLKCTKRTASCHGSCSPYKFYLAEKAIYNEFIQRQKIDEQDLHSFKIDAVANSKRRAGVR